MGRQLSEHLQFWSAIYQCWSATLEGIAHHSFVKPEEFVALHTFVHIDCIMK